MVRSCCAFNCTYARDKNPEVMFHTFPNAGKDLERRLKWINAIKRKDWLPTKHTRLCSAHFVATDYDPPVICGNIRLKKTAVPTVFDYPDLFLPEQVGERQPLVQIIKDKPELEPDLIEVNEVTREDCVI